MEMRKKHPVPFEQKFPNADPLAIRLLQRLLAFDPKDRPTAQEVCVYISCRMFCLPLLGRSSEVYFRIFWEVLFLFNI